MKRTPINPISPRREEKLAEAKRLGRDGSGMTILDVHWWLPKVDRILWPKAHPVKDASAYDVMARHRTVAFGDGVLIGTCWLCGRHRYLDICHIVAVPRSNEPANLFLACTCDPHKACYDDSCHARTEKPNAEQLQEILRAKLKYDKPHTSFLRIAQLRRRPYEFDSLD